MKLRTWSVLLATGAALLAGAVFASAAIIRVDSRFPHEKHARVFPLCVTCHVGVTNPGEPMWPEPSSCQSCHDGVVVKRVEWSPRSVPRRTNRRFTHEQHDRAVTAKNTADSGLVRTCSACHTESNAPRMSVRSAVVERCLDCHGLTGGAPHFDVPGEACATCHLRLTDARTLVREDIARFPKPSSHAATGFLLGGHGKLARVPGFRSGPRAVNASCATCHARNLCLSCHVNAPESPVIMALALDERTPAYASGRLAPASHRASGFLGAHGREAQKSNASCATCHTRESCASCHVGALTGAIAALPAAGEGRAPGAHVIRTPPQSHTLDFRARHGVEADARPTSCATCHTRSTCLECHRPDGGGVGGGRQSRFHPRAFLTRHPASAYARESGCSDCHNPAQFCEGCHQRAGLVATARIGLKGYHDAFRGFSLGHGQAARQSLESCASCHAERDCTACHAATGGGFRFNPHGPGFNAARMRAKNPSMCVACHGRVIPGVP